MFENRDYISLSVSDDSIRKKSFKRVKIIKFSTSKNFLICSIIYLLLLTLALRRFQQWNQLSRFQKNILLLLVCGALVTIFVLVQGQERLPKLLRFSSAEHPNRANDRIQIVPLKVSKDQLSTASTGRDFIFPITKRICVRFLYLACPHVNLSTFRFLTGRFAVSIVPTATPTATG